MKSEGLNRLSPECFVELSPGDAGRYKLKTVRRSSALQKGRDQNQGEGVG